MDILKQLRGKLLFEFNLPHLNTTTYGFDPWLDEVVAASLGLWVDLSRLPID